MIIILIWWLQHYQEGSLKLVMVSSIWWFHPHNCEGGISWVWSPFLCGERPKYDYPISLTYLSGESQFRFERERVKIIIQKREKRKATYSHFSATSLTKSMIPYLLTIGSSSKLKGRFKTLISKFWLFKISKQVLS